MRIAILSDIHGNKLALEAVLRDLEHQRKCDEIIVAGDLVWAGPWPVEVVDRVRAIEAKVIQGNTDAYFGRSSSNVPSGKDDVRFSAQLAWMVEQLGPDRVEFLANLPFSLRFSPVLDHDLLIVHANPHDLEQTIAPALSDADLDSLLGDSAVLDWEVLAFGHVHVPYERRWRDRLLVDVASVGLPMDGDERAAYGILEWDGFAWRVEHRRVLYDVPAVAHQMITGGLPRGKHFAERLISARRKIARPALAMG